MTNSEIFDRIKKRRDHLHQFLLQGGLRPLDKHRVIDRNGREIVLTESLVSRRDQYVFRRRGTLRKFLTDLRRHVHLSASVQS